MTRQRQVFPRETVAHLWANKAQDQARDPSGNFYFTGPTLYSYGSHFVIAHWLDDGRLLWNDATYGPTTSKHQWIARSAVPRHHLNTALHVPSLDVDGTRTHHFADTARHCIEAAMTALESAQKARQRRGDHIDTARDYLHSARELYVLAGQKKAAQLVPEVAADADKAAIADVLRKVKAAEYIAQAEEFLKRARKSLTEAQHFADETDESITRHSAYRHSTRAQDVMREVRDVRTLCDKAREQFKRAGKQSTAVANIARAADTLAARFEAQAKADDHAAHIADMHGLYALMVGSFAIWKRRQTHLDAASFGNVGRYRSYNMPRMFEKIEETLAHLGAADVPAYITRGVERMQRALRVSRFTHELSDVRAALQEVGAEPPSGRALVAAIVEGLPPYWEHQAHELAAQCEAARVEWDALVRERNAQAIEAWRAGQSVRLPHEVPTMARIIGDQVETSRAAFVPLAHACRLARLARRVMRNGGQSWQPGHGPRVGHFEVLRIGADGSATIGCHEFDAEEGMRALAMLDACPACANVREENAEGVTA